MAEDLGEKTEDATPRKISKAREGFGESIRNGELTNSSIPKVIGIDYSCGKTCLEGGVCSSRSSTGD